MFLLLLQKQTRLQGKHATHTQTRRQVLSRKKVPPSADKPNEGQVCLRLVTRNGTRATAL